MEGTKTGTHADTSIFQKRRSLMVSVQLPEAMSSMMGMDVVLVSKSHAKVLMGTTRRAFVTAKLRQ